MPQLRIALTLPGEASLGTFEAGAVCALLIGVQRIHQLDAIRGDGSESVRVDVMSGSSSGSLTAVLATRSLLAGQDPVAPLRRAWVSEPSLKALRQGSDAPLSLNRARQVAREVLARDFPASGAPQPSPVRLTFALGCLRGFRYALGRPDRPQHPLHVTSYADWAEVELAPDEARGYTGSWSSVVDAAIASASHPLAFPAAVLDRSRQREAYLRKGIVNLPDQETLELRYTDGGLLDRQPLGRCLDHVQQLDRDASGPETRRLVLVVRTDCDRAPDADDPAWTGSDEPPDWPATLARALRLVTTHSLHEDIRRMQKTNSSLRRTNRLAHELAGLLDHSARDVLIRVLHEMDAETEALFPERDVERHGTPDKLDGLTLEALLERTLNAAAGQVSKLEVAVELVNGDPSQLASTSVARFGGFLAERMRAQDFLVGYRDMTTWMARTDCGLVHHGLAPELAAAAYAAARERESAIPGWLGGSSQVRPGVRNSGRILAAGLRAVGHGLRRSSV